MPEKEEINIIKFKTLQINEKNTINNEENDKNGFQFRSSSSVFMKVPFNSMNEKMRFINRMGGTIVSIKPVTAGESSGESENAE